VAVPPAPNQTRMTIRVDTELLDWFREQVDSAGGGNYQTIINEALREYIQHHQEPIQTSLCINAIKLSNKTPTKSINNEARSRAIT